MFFNFFYIEQIFRDRRILAWLSASEITQRENSWRERHNRARPHPVTTSLKTKHMTIGGGTQPSAARSYLYPSNVTPAPPICGRKTATVYDSIPLAPICIFPSFILPKPGPPKPQTRWSLSRRIRYTALALYLSCTPLC